MNIKEKENALQSLKAKIKSKKSIIETMTANSFSKKLISRKIDELEALINEYSNISRA